MHIPIAKLKSLIVNISAKGFFHLISANLLIQVFAFGSQFFVAWILTPEQLGQIKIMQTFLDFGVLVAVMGFDSSTLKLCSENRSKDEVVFIYKQAIKYVSYSLFVVFPLLVIASLSGIISKDQVINHLFPFFTIALIPMAFNNLMSVYLQARKEMKSYSKIQAITKFSTLLIIVLLTYIFNIFGFLSGVVLSFLITHFVLKKKIKALNDGENASPVSDIFRTHWNYSKYSVLANFVGLATTHTDILLMNYFISDRYAIGQYSFAITATLFTKVFTSTVQQLTTPFLSEKADDKRQLKKAHSKYYRLNIISSFAILVFSVLTIPFIIKFVFNGKYDYSIQFFVILMISWFIQSMSNFKGYTLWGLGEIKINFLSSLIIAVGGLAISLVMMSEWGIIGLVYAKLITNMYAAVVVGILFTKVMKKYEVSD